MLLSILICGCTSKEKNNNLSIIGVNYPCYDFIRAITINSDTSVRMLLTPGVDVHDYEPTPKDIIDIQNSNMFVYVGGESDEWVKGILDSIDMNKTKVIRLMDYVDTLKEEVVKGMDFDNEELDIDEHIWTSPKNAIELIKVLSEEIIKLDSKNEKIYTDNTSFYIRGIERIDERINEVLSTSKRKELIFGDRFPFRYFTKDYNLKYYAAFLGCADKTEASAKTISFLVDKVKKDKIPVILKLELSSGNIANAISKETNAKVLEFHSFHNISKEDFEKGINYIQLWYRNIEVLMEVLN